MNEEIRAGQEQGVFDVERQIAEGKDPIYIEGRPISREAAWAATQGIRATWKIPGARATARSVFESGQWWVLVQVPIGQFPG